jgi:hypothetical protein
MRGVSPRFTLSLLFAITACFATLAASAQDIYCGCSKQTYARPGNCLRGSATEKACSKRINCTGCMIIPKCKGLDVPAFKQFYNRALFGIGNVGLLGMAGPNANDVLVAWTINYWFKPNKNTDFNIVWGKPEDTEDWAHVEPASASGGKPTLTVSPDAIWLSPAGFVNGLGHEMIHVEQIKRKYSVRMTGINSALNSFRELEASSWETGETDFKWAIGNTQWYGCEPADEKQGAEETRQCRDWQVKKAIQDIRTGMRSAQYMPVLEKYLKEDPWTSQVWLKQHPDWKTITAGAAPKDCSNP